MVVRFVRNKESLAMDILWKNMSHLPLMDGKSVFNEFHMEEKRTFLSFIIFV